MTKPKEEYVPNFSLSVNDMGLRSRLDGTLFSTGGNADNIIVTQKNTPPYVITSNSTGKAIY